MSIYEDFVAVLSGVTDGRIYPKAAPVNTPRPFITWQRTSSDPTVTIHGGTLATKSVFVFECWADTYIAALAIADQVRDAVDASVLDATREPSAGDEYEPSIDVFMEPVAIGFWH